MTILTNRIVAVDITAAVYEITHIAAVPLAIYDDVLKIKVSRFGEQCNKFVCYILFGSKMG